ncbi:MAG: Spy/CpxP family protein refolding chaperone [Verrucomicrobia bacterium]|nr:Spy/CpxP family protein refolding chaperone [Verrucomicrobiota bacterium]MBU4290182.1 Spy/CpxP family protein refolding chaperone [Verrucomicrobiota bacterium]MBU4427777.1 Spy/CpxP family protein refolding chaperone [Verrucomicrobiota bacterium]MBU4497928.1 Spy/CpxP family protein refolding chaperone [Verrucomicrobiota bacterium]MCG2681694.1 Spy/CpxP family protein refolding chaperone [Kiritimatiellia bacterium]
MKDTYLLLVAVLLTGLNVGPGLAEMDNPPPPDANAQPMDHKRGLGQGLASELGLSADKANEIKNMIHETRKTMIKLKTDRDLAKADLEHLISADTLDEKAIMAAADKLAQINAEMTKAQVKARLAMSATLTPEQRARVNQLRQGMIARFKERREGRQAAGRERRSQAGGESGADKGGEF